MPRVLEINGYVFYFFTADCMEREHIHIKKGNGYGKIWIKPEIEICYLKGFKQQEERQILKLVKEYKTRLTKYWDDYCNNRQD